MLIVTTGPLDGSDETCALLRAKLDSYLYAATHANFASRYPAARSGRIRIFVSSTHSVSECAHQLVEAFAKEALIRNVEVKVGDPVA
jgi:hypothetical protein